MFFDLLGPDKVNVSVRLSSIVSVSEVMPAKVWTGIEHKDRFIFKVGFAQGQEIVTAMAEDGELRRLRARLMEALERNNAR